MYIKYEFSVIYSHCVCSVIHGYMVHPRPPIRGLLWYITPRTQPGAMLDTQLHLVSPTLCQIHVDHSRCSVVLFFWGGAVFNLEKKSCCIVILWHVCVCCFLLGKALK